MVKYNERQQLTVNAILEGKNILLTAKGGAGKSFVINNVKDDNFILAAPTGIAALNIGGCTLHSLFGLPFGVPEEKDWMSINKTCKSVFSKNDVVLVIDEAGMINAQTLDLIDAKLKIARMNNKPFGGIQVILVGDFLQLEPILKGGIESKEYYKEYDTPFCFGAKSFKGFEIHYLTEAMRQSDKRQVMMLDSIRMADKHCEKALDYLIKEGEDYRNSEDTLHLACYNADADMLNQYWYNKIKDEQEVVYEAQTKGNIKDKDKPVPDKLKLKVGTKVIIKANDPNLISRSYVNGQRGTVMTLNVDSVGVRLDSGGFVTVEAFTWEKYKYSRGIKGLSKSPDGTFTQIPLRLGYSVSIHSSQGMTLEGAAIDIGRGCFSNGQLYVALSRVKDTKKLAFVRNPTKSDIKSHPDAVKFYENLLLEEKIA